jgi:hypothetical protein
VKNAGVKHVGSDFGHVNKYFVIKQYHTSPVKRNPKVFQSTDAFLSGCADRGTMFGRQMADHYSERSIPHATRHWASVRPQWTNHFMFYYVVHWKRDIAAKTVISTLAT